VTTDRGAHVLFSGKVPAGLSAMQTLSRARKVGTRYGGRYVQSIDGVSGSLGAQKDWFLFVNGVESDTGAADVKIRPGDVEWWDYRSWKGKAMTVPVVLGAFPEPFLHGFQWAKPGATVLYTDPSDAGAAHAIARAVHGTLKAELTPPGVIKTWMNRGNTILVGGPGVPSIQKTGNLVLLRLPSKEAAHLASLRYEYGTGE
jgi:hypothetical protein